MATTTEGKARKIDLNKFLNAGFIGGALLGLLIGFGLGGRTDLLDRLLDYIDRSDVLSEVVEPEAEPVNGIVDIEATSFNVMPLQKHYTICDFCTVTHL